MRDDVLAAFVAATRRRPFKWGVLDCLLWLADWLVVLGYPDAAATWRGTYTGRLGANRILAAHGGAVGLIEAGLRSGLARTATPGTGDIGVVRVLTPRGPELAGAIFSGDGWMVLCPAGVLIIRSAVAEVSWRV